MASSTDHGAWGRLERSEYTFDEFCAAFAAECLEAGGEVDARELMMQIGRGFSPRPEMMQAIASIRAHGLKVAALTNNWARTDTAADDVPHSLGHLGAFDVVVESAVEGLRKPDPRIYTLVCDRLGIAPDEAVFLDDLGVNLKPAREMGMTTIKVVDADERARGARDCARLRVGRLLMQLLLIRHAEPVRIGPEESGGEPVDPGLTALGLEQAARLGAWLAGEPVHHVVSSSLRRARETAEPIAAAHGLEVVVLPELREYDHNADHYIPVEELRETHDDRWQAMVEGRWEDFGGEAPDTFRARIVPCLDALINEHAGKRSLRWRTAVW